MKRKFKNKSSFVDHEENLRGRYRELKKQLEAQSRYISHLENLLAKKSSKNKKANENKVEISKEKENFCPRCGSNEFFPKPFWSPNKEIVWIICSICKYKEKIK